MNKIHFRINEAPTKMGQNFVQYMNEFSDYFLFMIYDMYLCNGYE
jgi:hypothetical protein